MPQRRLFLLSVGLVLMATAWMFATPPFRAPDEPAHYLRAMTIANGHLLGPRVGVAALGEPILRGPGQAAAQQRWNSHDLRAVSVPAALAPSTEPCSLTVMGRCTEITYTGDYFPTAYVLPAVAIALSTKVGTAQWLTRAAALLPVLVFFLLALALLLPGAGWSCVGLLAAITPMVLFTGSILNPSGLEVAANLAFVAALLRLGRDPAGSPRWAWPVLAASGAVTILSWQIGPIFVAGDLLVCVLLGTSADWRTVRHAHRRALGASGVVLLVALAVFLAYGSASGVLHSRIGVRPIGSSLRGGIGQMGPVLRDAIGDFGSLDSKLPGFMPPLWWAGVLGLIAAAAVRGGRRQRLALVLTLFGALAFPVVFFAWSYRFSGFGLQGRYVLPALMLVPLVAGEVLERNGVRAGRAGRVTIAVIAVFQLAAWWINADHWAATSAFGLLSHAPVWKPPVGWPGAFCLALIGALAWLTAALTEPLVPVARPQASARRARAARRRMP